MVIVYAFLGSCANGKLGSHGGQHLGISEPSCRSRVLVNGFFALWCRASSLDFCTSWGADLQQVMPKTPARHGLLFEAYLRLVSSLTYIPSHAEGIHHELLWWLLA